MMSTEPLDREFSEMELLQADRERFEADRKVYNADTDAKIDAINGKLKQRYFDFIEHRAGVPAKDLQKLLRTGRGRWTEAAENVLSESEKPMSARMLVSGVQNSGYPHVTSNMVSTWLTRVKGKGLVERRVFTNKKSGKKIGKWEWLNDD